MFPRRHAHSRASSARPITTMAGDQSFAELFFTDVRVPASAMLGDVDDGWSVATRTLVERAGRRRQPVPHAAAQVRPADRTPSGRWTRVGRDSVAARYIEVRMLELLGQALDWRGAGRATARRRGQRGQAGVVAVRPAAGEHRRRPDCTTATGRGARRCCSSRSMTIAGGTTEVNKNIIGERVLGLPREPSLARLRFHRLGGGLVLGRVVRGVLGVEARLQGAFGVGLEVTVQERLVSCTACGGCAARRCANASAASSSSSRGNDEVGQAELDGYVGRDAVAGEHVLLGLQQARAAPASVTAPPSPATSATDTCGSARNAVSAMNTMSHNVAMVQPSPTAGPFTAATTGSAEVDHRFDDLARPGASTRRGSRGRRGAVRSRRTSRRR